MNDQGGVITNKIFRLRFRLRMEFMLNFNLRNGDYQNPEIVFVLRPQFKTQRLVCTLLRN